ncbi:hypothetical protein K469DRAFT_729574 [Zopfia rhizophila CBS 207.26]|uniref:Xylanolytic transcriptional activator regulatory domain-containing protein n=1 Tax=Zopfia rhizophila CBS 207.26 TaxID=1314779 RepID=A0A6A6DSD0_9PEZI|nr:hypothetical protein K469DRAFT_729574 [Zopfia rhizophila CBS 207.26]
MAFSTSGFFDIERIRILEQIGDAGQTPVVSIGGSVTTTQLQSKPSLVADAVTLFLPTEVAYFLSGVFFDFAQTNYSYVDEHFLRDKLRGFYSSSLDLDIVDASWVCTVLLMFAIGTQFAHLSSKNDEDSSEGASAQHDNTQSTDDQLALAFYHRASKLIPDVIAAASIESVQAFLLLGVYALPIDAAGLSCTYFGIAIRIAMQNGMHRKHHTNLEPRQIELRRRIWWTAYTLERRLCVLHGRPVSIARADVDCDLPGDRPELRAFTNVNTMPNILAMIKLTDVLEAAGNKRYLDPAKPLFRFNIHLALTYHLIHIFIGRSFILNSKISTSPGSSSDPQPADWKTTREGLVSDCIRSTVAVIGLCQTLHDEVGLARASYTEFTSCCAALLAVLAQRISAETPKMSIGIYSNSEKLTVEALETAIRRLQADRRGTKADSRSTVRQAYAQFRNWAALRQSKPMGLSSQTESQKGYLNPAPQDLVPPAGSAPESPLQERSNFGIYPGYEQFDLGDFVSVPGLDEWFRYGLH